MRRPIEMAEGGLLPDGLIRFGIRRLQRHRLRQIAAPTSEAEHLAKRAFIRTMNQDPVALHTQEANEQHYEMPPAFFEQVLGRRLKYSCCYYPTGDETLDQAEEAMLALYSERAGLADGMAILELGCGWGSLTRWMAEKYPHSPIVALSNSNLQRQFIEKRCQEHGLDNVQVLTCDVNHFETAEHFDRIVSVEMFEHLRNWRQMLKRLDAWLHPKGKAFIHVFCHRQYPYLFEIKDDDDWMSKYFFTGGLMPSSDLLQHFQEHLTVEDQWYFNGSHYARTARHWLENLDLGREAALAILADHYGEGQAKVWLQRWRIFFMACEELWGLDGGEQWGVVHYLLEKKASIATEGLELEREMLG